ncbi:nucleotidyltransferase family protein [Desulfosporosinus shakirovi]|uniref:nucleotidyltransferase family protein n=1 Tax=Desulfosporosinus shakirovi TaxID=2885154 RepID=UPI001E3FCC46|nr:nucleotidyltransferase family protein [Desulfosporosinus sp. SRJS8]MCB8818310.1 nucleotidyltransferase family protein [Desulfosporosinus sp. SRJS8]
MSIENKIVSRVKQFDESLQSKVLNYINSLAESNGIKLKQDVLDLKEITAEVIKVVDQYGVVKAGVFGSYARGEANDESDIDLLFEFKEVIGLMKLGGLKADLEEALGKKIDIFQFCAINPQIRDHVLQEVKIIYEQGRSAN